jgi:hypothetical protein
VTRENDSICARNWTGRLEAKVVKKLRAGSGFALTVIASVLVMTVAKANGPWLESGPKVGEIADMFAVRAVTGPYRGKTLCFRCKLGAHPVVCIFARRVTVPLISLFKQLDAVIATGHDDLKALVVFLTDDAETTAANLNALAERNSLVHVPLATVSDPHGPQDYRIADDADVTILMWKGPTVRANRAFGHDKMTEGDVKDVLQDVHKVLKSLAR